jgi:hypothetical protein
MSALPTVSPDWLAVRGAADDLARSRALVDEVRGRLAAGPIVVHDLGSGAGAMMRWLAPQLPGPQRWVLHDADARILACVDPEPPLDSAGGAVAVQTSVERLDELPGGGLAGATLVTSSALLDVLTEDEARAVVGACAAAGAPVLFSLTVTGRVRLSPAEIEDGPLQSAFNDHQRRDADGRRLLGPDAVHVTADLFAAAGWRSRTVGTPWRLGAADRDLMAEWLDGWMSAAVEQRPELRRAALAYAVRRHAQLADDTLRVVVHHEDLLAWPA